MAQKETSQALTVLGAAKGGAAHENAEWLTILRSSPSAQVTALEARGLGRTAVLFLQNACESRCFFCANPGVTSPGESAITPSSDIEAWMASASAAPIDRICIAGNEPTRHPQFEQTLIALDARLGLPIELMTSGLGLSEPGTSARWSSRGVRSVAVPLYSEDAATHDEVVGTDRAHARVLAGLDAASANGIAVFVHTLALRRTLSGLDALAALTRERWGARLAVGVSRPKLHTWSWENDAATFDELARAASRLDVSLIGFPSCVAPGLPRGAATVIDVYFRTTATSFADACAPCLDRARCPGVLAEELARGATLRPRLA